MFCFASKGLSFNFQGDTKEELIENPQKEILNKQVIMR